MSNKVVHRNDTRLTVPEGIALGPSGLTINRDLSFEEWQGLGETLRVVHHASLFWLGDWLHHGEQRFDRVT